MPLSPVTQSHRAITASAEGYPEAQYSVPLKPEAIEQHVPCPSVEVYQPHASQSHHGVPVCQARRLAAVNLRPSIDVQPLHGSPVQVPLQPEVTERHVP